MITEVINERVRKSNLLVDQLCNALGNYKHISIHNHKAVYGYVMVFDNIIVEQRNGIPNQLVLTCKSGKRNIPSSKFYFYGALLDYAVEHECSKQDNYYIHIEGCEDAIKLICIV